MEATSLEFPNLEVTLPESKAKTWEDWYEDFVIQGNCSEDQEKTGTLTFLSPNLKQELARVNFFNLGIYSLTPEKSETGSDQMQRVKAGLYCERMEFVSVTP